MNIPPSRTSHVTTGVRDIGLLLLLILSLPAVIVVAGAPIVLVARVFIALWP